MRKPHRLVVGLLALVALAGACDDEFLTEVPSDFVSPENFYRNEGDALAAVNAAYATFINLSSPLGSSDYVSAARAYIEGIAGSLRKTGAVNQTKGLLCTGSMAPVDRAA